MFCLKKREDFCVYILPSQEKIFGKLGDIKLEGDATISRKHATVSVQLTDESDTQYKCVIIDTSKYGTFVTRNNEKIKLVPNENFVLKAGDIVQFGLKDTTFVVSSHVFVTARSSLDVENVEKLRTIVHLLKGRILENWENACTHLTVNKTVPVTAKITLALATLKPIVTIEYWEAISVAVKEFKTLPKIEDFLPTIRENFLSVSSNLLLPNEKRRTLFKGLSFVHFCAKQYYAYAPVITAAGGKSCVYPTKRPLTPRDLTAKNAIVVQQPVSDSSEITPVIPADYSIIHRKLQDIRRRMISETEIPLAVLHCSTEMYCNPLFKFSALLKSKPNVAVGDVLVEETQDAVGSDARRAKRTAIIPETLDSQDGRSARAKRVRFFDERNELGDVAAGTSGTTREDNTPRNDAECEIIPETVSSLNSVAASSDVSLARGVSMRVLENAVVSATDRRDIIIPETCNSSNASSGRNSLLSRECEIIPETCASSSLRSAGSSVSPRRSRVSGERSDNVVVNVFSNKIDGRNRVVAETRRSPSANVLNIFSSQFTGKNNCTTNQRPRDENDVANEPREQTSRIVREKNDSEEKNSPNSQQVENLFRANATDLQQREIILMNEEENFILENVDLPSLDENERIVERSTGDTSRERSRDSANKQIITIEETDDDDDNDDDDGYTEQRKENNVPGKRATRDEPKRLLKERQLGPVSDSERNRENNRAKENETEQKNKTKPRNTEGNRHERYPNPEYTDKLLRKDAPNGKIFKKALVIIPERRLQEDDFY